MANFIEIERYLKEQGIDFKIINLSEVAVSFEDVVRLSKGQIKIEEIVKTLLLQCIKPLDKVTTNRLSDSLSPSESYLAVILKGVARIDFSKLKILVGECRMATKDEVKQVVGVDPGAVCPILIGVPVKIDQNVAQLNRVNMGSGDHSKGLEMNFADLLTSLSEYRIEEIV